jgi:hypothetical protein
MLQLSLGSKCVSQKLKQLQGCKFENFSSFLKMSRYIRAKYNQNYKTRARMRRAQNSRENDTENAGPVFKTNAQYCRKYRQLRRHLTSLSQVWMWISSLMRWRVQWRSTQTHRTHLAYPIWQRGPKIWNCTGADSYLKFLS